MANHDTIFDALATPVLAGFTIVLLLGVRQTQRWGHKDVAAKVVRSGIGQKRGGAF